MAIRGRPLPGREGPKGGGHPFNQRDESALCLVRGRTDSPGNPDSCVDGLRVQ
jgi:hypothetical protein